MKIWGLLDIFHILPYCDHIVVHEIPHIKKSTTQVTQLRLQKDPLYNGKWYLTHEVVDFYGEWNNNVHVLCYRTHTGVGCAVPWCLIILVRGSECVRVWPCVTTSSNSVRICCRKTTPTSPSRHRPGKRSRKDLRRNTRESPPSFASVRMLSLHQITSASSLFRRSGGSNSLWEVTRKLHKNGVDPEFYF